MRALSYRLLPVLQLTRMALVFTAIADSVCEYLLRTRLRAGNASILGYIDAGELVAIVLMSVGMYGFGMSLNDIIDRRRDRQIAAHRPLPSGRIGIVTAHVICAVLGVMALAAGSYYAWSGGSGWMSVALVIFTGLLIAFYDFAGKYLVPLGLLSLGLIRFFHCLVAAPDLPLLWHPLWLLNHVAILSTVGYAWEKKRPTLTRTHWFWVICGLAFLDAVAIGLTAWRRHAPGRSLLAVLRISGGLWWPLAATAAFVLLAAVLRWRSASSREAGQKLVLYGLLWLIVYDAAFAAGYVGYRASGLLLFLMPVAWFAVQLMRWWSRILAVSHRPQYQRAAPDGGVHGG